MPLVPGDIAGERFRNGTEIIESQTRQATVTCTIVIPTALSTTQNLEVCLLRVRPTPHSLI